MAFEQIICDAAIGIKTTAVIDDNRRLFDQADKVHGNGQSFVIGSFAENNFHQQHFFHRREEVNADKTLGICGILRQRCDGQGRGIGGENDAFIHHVFSVLDGSAFDVAVFKHGLDHQITAAQVGVIRAGHNSCQHGVARCTFQAAFGHLIGQQFCRMRLALFG